MEINTTLKLTRRLQVQKLAKEVYISDSIPCQIDGCQFCQNEGELLDISDDQNIFIIDTDVLLLQLDVVEQFSRMKNLIIMDSSVKISQKKSQAHFSQLQNLLGANYSKSCYVYPDKFSSHTQGKSDRIIQLSQYYKTHTSQFVSAKVNVIMITNNFQTFQNAKQLKQNVYTLPDYIKSFGQEYQDLLDYLGYTEMEEEVSHPIIYPIHYTVEQCVDQIKQGLLFEGKLSVDRNDKSLSKIFVRKLGFEILITDQNRSMHGDRVAVQLLPQKGNYIFFIQKEWLKQKQQTEVKFEDDETENQDYINTNEESLNDIQQLQNLYKLVTEKKMIPSGKVVGVLERVDKKFCGHCEREQDHYVVYPADGRYPYFRLKTQAQLIDKKIMISLIDWPDWSDKPRAKLCQVLGDSGDMRVEGNVILLEHQVEIKEFSRAVLGCLPAEGVKNILLLKDKWKVPQEEILRRLDLRDLPIVSIDPIGCRDIDDALHCRVLPDGNYEVGVHIADVSHFVRPDAAIDKEAAHRCTTVYLVDRRTDMLPKLLTENLCSLVCNVDHLAFSVIWVMDQNAKIISTRFGKSVINSKASLNYGQAQEMIDDKKDQTEITQSVRFLNLLAKELKQTRILAGALTLASNQVKFTFDDETHNPTDVRLYAMYDTNSLVEEFMLLANVSVAEKILSRFPAISILRNHSQPKAKQIKELQDLMIQLGYNFNYNTSKELGESLDAIKRLDDPFFNRLIRVLTTRCMNEVFLGIMYSKALYICTADVDFPELFHYGLATQLYTHFTSPIRRYADILVHRLLAAAIDLESLPASMSNKIRMSRICDKMNMRHRNARFASRASSDYNTYLFFKNRARQGFTEEVAIITGIQNNGFTVTLPEYGLEGFIDFKDTDKQLNNPLTLTLNQNQHQIFDYIKVKIEVQLKNFHKQVTLTYLGHK